jgi:hypothetical protein
MIAIATIIVLIVVVLLGIHYGHKPKAIQAPKPAPVAVVPAPAPREPAPNATAAGKAPSNPKPEPHKYPIVEGDRLLWIADAACNATSRYQEIADLSGVKDADKIYFGRQLLIPGDCKADFTPRRAHGYRHHDVAIDTTITKSDKPVTSASVLTADQRFVFTVPKYNRYDWNPYLPKIPLPTISTGTNVETASNITAPPVTALAAPTQSAAAPSTTLAKAVKGRIWYEIQIAPDVFPRQIADGSFAAFLVNHKSPASRAKYKLYLKTGVIVTHDGNGDAHVFAELKQAPTESQKLALVFVAAQSGPFQIGTVTLGKGHVVESAPHALPKFKRSDYTELQLDFPLRPKNQGKVVVLCSAQAGIGLIFGPWGPLATGGACVISQLF